MLKISYNLQGQMWHKYLVIRSDFFLERKIPLWWYDKKGGKGYATTGKVPVWCITTYTISDSGYIYINCTHMQKFPFIQPVSTLATSITGLIFVFWHIHKMSVLQRPSIINLHIFSTLISLDRMSYTFALHLL